MHFSFNAPRRAGRWVRAAMVVLSCAAVSLVARAQTAGHLRADVTALDVSWLIEQFSRRPPGRLEAAEERNVRSRLVAIALAGLRAHPGLAPGRPGSLPGHPPRPDDYVNRWSPGS